MSKRQRSSSPGRRRRDRSRSPARRWSPSPPPKRRHGKKQRICLDYARGSCFRGNECWFLHEEVEERDRSQRRSHGGSRREASFYAKSRSRELEDDYHNHRNDGYSRRDRVASPNGRKRYSRRELQSSSPRPSTDHDRHHGPYQEENEKHRVVDTSLPREAYGVEKRYRGEQEQLVEKRYKADNGEMEEAHREVNGKVEKRYHEKRVEDSRQEEQEQLKSVEVSQREEQVIHSTELELERTEDGYHQEALEHDQSGGPEKENSASPDWNGEAFLDVSNEEATPRDDATGIGPQKVDNGSGTGVFDATFGALSPEMHKIHGRSPSDDQKKAEREMRSLRVLRNAITDFVKQSLKPAWKEGHLSKVAFKTIAQKAVEKVMRTLQSHEIPKGQAKIEQFMDSSHAKITKLVKGYLDKYVS